MEQLVALRAEREWISSEALAIFSQVCATWPRREISATERSDILQSLSSLYAALQVQAEAQDGAIRLIKVNEILAPAR